MKRWIAVLLIGVPMLLPAFGQPPLQPDLREELLRMRDADQAVRAGDLDTQQGLDALDAADARHTARLKQIVAEYGWPSVSLVGDDGAHAAWLLAQHADADPAFQRDVLAWIAPLVAAGEVRAMDYAYLWDRTHTPQRYGSQGRCVGEREWAPREIEDAGGVDVRRAEVGLPPMAEYIPRVAVYCRSADP